MWLCVQSRHPSQSLFEKDLGVHTQTHTQKNINIKYNHNITILLYLYLNKCSLDKHNYNFNSIYMNYFFLLPVLNVLSACGLRHHAHDQAVEILKLHSIPGWSEGKIKVFNFFKKKNKNVESKKGKQPYLDWSCWKEKQVISLHSQASEKCQPNTT